jgi:two-component system, cell cycle sensor histidine kinase and response regulator CckA
MKSKPASKKKLTAKKRVLHDTHDIIAQIMDTSPAGIAHLITDVIMPGMNGKELKERIETWHPGIKTIFMSGYTADIVANRGILDDGIQFLPKPFTPLLLARKVRILLNGEHCFRI